MCTWFQSSSRMKLFEWQASTEDQLAALATARHDRNERAS